MFNKTIIITLLLVAAVFSQQWETHNNKVKYRDKGQTLSILVINDGSLWLASYPVGSIQLPYEEYALGAVMFDDNSITYEVMYKSINSSLYIQITAETLEHMKQSESMRFQGTSQWCARWYELEGFGRVYDLTH